MQINVKRIIVKATNQDIITHQITSIVQCKLCSNLLIDPYDCLCCLQTFCRDCIKSYINANNHCPFTEFFSNNPFPKSPLKLLKKSSSNITQLIASLKFNCINKDNGCNDELTMDNLMDHDKKCVINHNHNIIKQNKLIETPPPSYKLQGKEMSFRNVKKSNDYDHDNDNDITNDDYHCLGVIHPNCNNNELEQKIDKIYEILNSFIYYNKHFEETPRFDKRKCNPSSSSSSSSSSSTFSPIEHLSNKSNRSNETLSNIANELTVLNEKISSIESKITPFNYSTNNSDSSKAKTSRVNTGNEKLVSMFDTSSLNNISIGYNNNTSTSNTTHDSIITNRISSKRLNLKHNCALEVKKSNVNESKKSQPRIQKMKKFDSLTIIKNNTNKEFNKEKNSSTLMNKESKKNISLLVPIPENVNECINSQQFIKNDIIQYIDEKCNKELKQYILELTLDNSNLFVQKIDEVIQKLATPPKEPINASITTEGI